MSKHAAIPITDGEPVAPPPLEVQYQAGFDPETESYQVSMTGGDVAMVAMVKKEGFMNFEAILGTFTENVPALLEELLESIESEVDRRVAMPRDVDTGLPVAETTIAEEQPALVQTLLPHEVQE